MKELTMRSGFSPAVLFPDERSELDAAVVQHSPRTRYDTVVAVRKSLQVRLVRGRYLNSKLFSDPAWDMLLELYAAAITQRRLSVSRLSERSGTPMTTTLRWIAALESEGLVERQPNPLDARQVFIVLSTQAVEAMDGFFADLAREVIAL